MCLQTPKPPQTHEIKVLSFNVEGLESELDDPHFVDMLYEHDISLLNETWKGDDSKVNLPGLWDFSLVRPKHKKKGRYSGGITVFCKQGIRSGIKVINSSEGFIWLKLDPEAFQLNNPLFICAAYIPPKNTSKHIHIKTDYFKSLTDSLIKYSNQGNILIAGDLNARLGGNLGDPSYDIQCIEHLVPANDHVNDILDQRSSCDNTTNCYGKKVEKLCQGFNLTIANGRAPGDRLGNFTCYANKGASVVDYIITDQRFYKSIKKLQIRDPEFGSVHTPLSLTLNFKFGKNTVSKKTPIKSPPKFIWNSLEGETLKNLLRQDDIVNKFEDIKIKIGNPNCTKTDADQLTKQLTDILFDISSKCLKLAKKRTWNRKPQKKAWYTSDCGQLKKRLRNLSRLLVKSPKDPYIRGKFLSTKKDYRKLMRLNKKMFEIKNVEKLESLTNQPKEFWDQIKKLNKGNKANVNLVSPENWVKHFSSINKKDPAAIPENFDHCSKVKKEVEDLLYCDKNNVPPCPILDRDFSLSEVVEGFKRLKKGKSSALDAISNDILKVSSNIIAPVVTAIFNRLLMLKHFPIQWATGLIVAIHKSGELDDPNNFRGITLNSCVSKLFTLLLNDRLTDFCENKGIINYNQVGFRKGFRTMDHAFTLRTLVDQAFYRKEKLYVCFVDFKKAYDSVWRNGLFLKLLKYGISNKFVELIQDMYARLQACVYLPNGLSLPFQSKVGLKQGCNLSPLLFNLFVNELPVMIEQNQCHAPQLNKIDVGCLLYADDLVLISESKEGLQKSLNVLNEFTNQWHLEINMSKTKCLTFSRGRKSKENIEYMLGGIPVVHCDSYCYLGVVFTRSGSFKTASKALNDKARGAMFSIIRNIYKHRTVNIQTMMELFDKMILPIATYSCELWGTNFIPPNPKNNAFLNKENLSKHLSENLHFRFLKMLLGVPSRTSNWAVATETGRFPIIIRVFVAMVKYLFHLNNSQSPIVKAALLTNINLANTGYKTWFSHIKRILQFCDIEHLLYTCDNTEINHQIAHLKCKLNTMYKSKWEEERVVSLNDGKLSVLSSVKGSFGLSEYLNLIHIPSYRIAITKMRISAHKFPIETGRYQRTPREDRVCPFGCNVVGDEYHYMLKCKHPFIRKVQLPLANNISRLHPECDTLDDKMKGRFYLNNNDPHTLNLVGKLCHKVQGLYRDMTY